MKFTALVAAVLLAPALDARELSVRVTRGLEGEELCTVQVDNAPVDMIVEEIADGLSELSSTRDYVVQGFGAETRAALVTVDMRNRPVDFVLEVILGSVGLEYDLRPGVITVREVFSDAMIADDLRAESMLAYASATRRFPTHPSAPGARLNQGELEERRGNLSAALGHYETIRDVYRNSPVVPEAMWRLGRVLEEMGNWSEANLTFRTLANLPDSSEYHAQARLEMARCATALGDPYRAIHVIEALDASHPATTYAARTDRSLVFARALVDAGRSMEALHSLEEVVAGKLDEEQRTQVFKVQAHAFEDQELLPEAAWAWQVYSRHVQGPARAGALENAARLSLDGNQELNVLFLERLAAEDDLADHLEPYVEEAKRRLGMTTGPSTRSMTPAETVRRADELFAAGNVPGASQLLEPLFARRADLSPEELVPLTKSWAWVLERRRGLDSALRMLRSVRETLEDIEHRSSLDICAASLFEEYELFEQAVHAYEGKY